MKKRTIFKVTAMAMAMLLMVTGCGSAAEMTQAPEGTEETTASTMEHSETAEEDTEVSAEEAVIYTNEELGFSVQLPDLLRDKMEIEVTEQLAYDEEITRINILYVGAEATVSLVAFEEMSQTAWEKMQAEGGPVGMELGVSEAGRVVILYTPQSNPFEEGSEDFDILQKLPQQLAVIKNTFAFE